MKSERDWPDHSLASVFQLPQHTHFKARFSHVEHALTFSNTTNKTTGKSGI